MQKIAQKKFFEICVKIVQCETPIKYVLGHLLSLEGVY